MRTSFFIAGKLSGNRAYSFSKPITMIAVAGVAIGMAVMIVTMAVVAGFQTEITNKVVGFGAHIQIVHFDSNYSVEMEPLELEQTYYPSLDTTQGIRHIQIFGSKAGLLKVGEDIQGIVLKGIGNDYDWSFFQDKILEGAPITFPDSGVSNDLMISKSLATLLNISLHDEARMFFLTGDSPQPRGRKFQVCCIFETGMEELDNTFVIGDINHIRKLNHWETGEVSGFEVIIDDFKDLDRIEHLINTEIPYDQVAVTIKDLYPQIFDWLNLQDINTLIIIILMLFVSIVTMISTLLIIILENTSTIGVLKALGAGNKLIREIFLTIAAKIALWGALIGNVIGIGACLLQKHFSIIKLPQESYYMSKVPIIIHPWHIVLLNLGIFATCLLMMWLASLIIAKISPIKTIKN